MKNYNKNFIWNVIGSMTISITSLIYMIIITNYLNLKEAGIFTFGFSSAIVLATFASYGGRSYQVTDTNNEISSFSYLFSRVITIFISIIIAVIFVVFNNYSFYKSIIVILLCIFKFLEEFSDVLYGIMQKNDKLYLSGMCQFIKSIINILLFFILTILFHNLLISISAILLNNLIFCLIIEYKIANKIQKLQFKIEKKELLSYFKINLITCLFTFLSIFIINSPKYAIDLLSSDKVQAIYGIVSMPATVIMLLGTFIINPLLVDIAKKYNLKEYIKVNLILSRIIIILLCLGVFGAFGAYLLGVPVLNLLYSKNFVKYKIELVIIVFGSVFYAISNVISNVLTAYRELKKQFILNLIIAILAIFINYFLVKKFNLLGGSIAFLIIVLLRAIIYYLLFKIINNKKINDKGNILNEKVG